MIVFCSKKSPLEHCTTIGYKEKTGILEYPQQDDIEKDLEKLY